MAKSSPIPAVDFLPEEQESVDDVADALMAYREARSLEGPQTPAPRAADLPDELKDALGLSAFPERLQNDMIALAHQLTVHCLQLAEQAEQAGTGQLQAEGPIGMQPPVQRINDTLAAYKRCLAKPPLRQMVRDAYRGGQTAQRLGSMLPGPIGKTLRPMMGILGGMATFGGAAAGWQTGCGQLAVQRMRSIQRSMPRSAPPFRP